MARIVPSDISRLALSGGHTYELETLQALKAQLPEDYTVFHGVHWSREYAAWTHFGEIDFVVLNRSGDVLFIEQKNGTLEESAAGLVKRYGQSEKIVADQLHRSVDKVREKYKWQNGNAQPLVVDYLIYCPDYRVKHINAAGLNSERVVDAAAKDGLAGRIQMILGPGTSRPVTAGSSRLRNFSTRPLSWYRTSTRISVPRKNSSSTRAGRWRIF